jgi:methyltransferase-like protein 6
MTDSIHGSRSNTERVLTTDEYECLHSPEQQDRQQVSIFKQNLYDKNAQKYWDQFYKRNTNNFFKDRHWTLREFNINPNETTKLFEVGCGVGNFLFPLLNELPNLFIYACDFSSTAIELVRQNPNYDEKRIQSFVCDLTDETEIPIEDNSIDFCSMIFVLSAIHPDKMSCVLKKIHKVRILKKKQSKHSLLLKFKVLKTDGYLLFRDYGLYDHAMFRFARQRQHKLSDNFYVRQDGTRAYFFSLEYLTNLLNECQFKIDELSYVLKETVNIKEDICVPRVFIQGKFQKK